MSARQLVAIGFRLFAIWLCVAALQSLAVISMLQQMGRYLGNSAAVGAMTIGAFLIVAVLVWLLSGVLARMLLSGLARIPETRFSAPEVVVVGCVLMGLWWLKESIIPLVALGLKARAVSSETGQSALVWLGSLGRLTAAMDLIQMAVAGFFVCRPYTIAAWVLRHAPVVGEPEARRAEPFHLLLRQTTELGLRQFPRADIVARLVQAIASHPQVHRQLPELEELLRYAQNPATRSTAARAIVLVGSDAAFAARDTAAAQLLEERDPEVVSDLAVLIALADQHEKSGKAASPAHRPDPGTA